MRWSGSPPGDGSRPYDERRRAAASGHPRAAHRAAQDRHHHAPGRVPPEPGGPRGAGRALRGQARALHGSGDGGRHGPVTADHGHGADRALGGAGRRGAWLGRGPGRHQQRVLRRRVARTDPRHRRRARPGRDPRGRDAPTAAPDPAVAVAAVHAEPLRDLLHRLAARDAAQRRADRGHAQLLAPAPARPADSPLGRRGRTGPPVRRRRRRARQDHAHHRVRAAALGRPGHPAVGGDRQPFADPGRGRAAPRVQPAVARARLGRGRLHAAGALRRRAAPPAAPARPGRGAAAHPAVGGRPRARGAAGDGRRHRADRHPRGRRPRLARGPVAGEGRRRQPARDSGARRRGGPAGRGTRQGRDRRPPQGRRGQPRGRRARGRGPETASRRRARVRVPPRQQRRLAKTGLLARVRSRLGGGSRDSHGPGRLTCRRHHGPGWSAPSNVRKLTCRRHRRRRTSTRGWTPCRPPRSR